MYSGSLRDYKNQYGVDAFSPLSSLLCILQNVNSENYNRHLPLYSLGQNQFKLQYGYRLLLSQPNIAPSLDHAPGYAQIIESYNSLLDSRGHMDAKRAEEYMKLYIKGLRYVFEGKHIKGNLSSFISYKYINMNYNDVAHKWKRSAFVSGLFNVTT